MLNVNGVAINFDGQNLFSNVNLQFLPGNCYGIIGQQTARVNPPSCVFCPAI